MVRTRSKALDFRECGCCFELKKLDDFPAKPPTAVCEHDVKTCLKCLQQWWTASIKNKYWSVIICPDCSEELLGELDFADNNMLDEDMDRIEYIHGRIRNGFNSLYRYCMQPSCTSGQICQSATIMNCQKCNGYDCVKCNAPFHSHATHEEYQQTLLERRTEIELSEKCIKIMRVTGNIVACPNCSCLIQRHAYATKVTCTRCIYTFMWEDAAGAARRVLVESVERGRVENSATKGRQVRFPEDEAHHRLIFEGAKSTELGPEMPGKG